MKKLILAMVTLAVLLNFSSVFAEGKGYKGASQQAFENANENAVFNRVGDWFATIGKSPEEKARIKAERQVSRAEKRAQKEVREQEKRKEQRKLKESVRGDDFEADKPRVIKQKAGNRKKDKKNHK